MTVAPVVVLGDALLDRDVVGTAERLCPDAPVPVVDVMTERTRPGGAALAAALAARDGAPVTLVTALAADAASEELRALVDAAGVTVVDVGLAGPTPEKVRVLAGSRPVVRIDRGAAPGAVGSLGAAARDALHHAAAVLVSDYGRGIAAAARELCATVARSCPVVWDPHPRGAEPVAGCRLVTPNEPELFGFAGADSGGVAVARLANAARTLVRRWNVHAVATTLGARGALVVQGELPPLVVAAPVVGAGDTCGAGDRFASAATVALANGAIVSEAVERAVRGASAFVADGGATAFDAAGGGRDRSQRSHRPPPTGTSALDVATRVRAAGGVVVATGGCFDLLHAGHVATLQAARRLGDCLVVLVNSDASVRRRKGPERPLQPATDRVAMLAALDCVDAIEVFDDDTPVPALERLRPDVFAKGGDYALDDLPEAPALAAWGGATVLLPYLADRSTTRLVQRAQQGSGPDHSAISTGGAA